MAMFEKLFVKRDLDDINFVTRKLDGRCCELAAQQVRLLLFKECDWRGRKLLFDSATIEKVPSKKDDKPIVGHAKQFPCILEVSEGYKYLYKGPAVDASLLGEMIFGAVAMNVKNVSLKIHIMDDPRRVMCTKVFCVPAGRPVARKISEPCTGDVRGKATTTKPLGANLTEEGLALSFSIDRGDSGFYGEHSPQSSVCSTSDCTMSDTWEGYVTPDDSFSFHCPPGRKLSTTSSNGSWQRRTSMNLATRFEFANEGTNLLTVPRTATNITSLDSQIYSNSSASGTSDSLSSATSSVNRRRKFGLALLITVADNAKIDVVRKCVEQSPQLQSLMRRVRSAARVASIAAMFAVTTKAHSWLSDLLYGPRLQPIWLTLVTSDVRSCNKLADKLVADICSVLSVGDTKITNFFISTLLTHILTYHLGWVTTVSPYDTVDSKMFVDGSEKRSYNALWAQLTDLCGSIGFPPRTARTIISGATNANFMNKLLRVLTYFVRCGDVKKIEFKYQDCVVHEGKVISVDKRASSGLIKTKTKSNLSVKTLNENVSNSECSATSMKTVVYCEPSMKKSTTLGNLSGQLSNAPFPLDEDASISRTSIRRTVTTMLPLNASSDSSLTSSAEEQPAEQNVVFVLGDDDKLVGLKNKSNSGKSVKKSSKTKMEAEKTQDEKHETKECIKDCSQKINAGSPSKCCSQTRQHSKPIKHSGFKFEFDKYPQIVTNYMKSKNLEILDRHYLGKPGNLKLDNYQFDPTVVPPIEEETCEICYKCQMMEATLQTPTNASEMEYMNDIPRQTEPQYAKETIVEDERTAREISPKTFVRKRKGNTVVVNMPQLPCIDVRNIDTADQKERVLHEKLTSEYDKSDTVNVEDKSKLDLSIPEIKQPESNRVNKPLMSRLELRRAERDRKESKLFEVKQVIEYPLPNVCVVKKEDPGGRELEQFGGVTDHYVPDLILQGTTAPPSVWETELRRDLELTTFVNRTQACPIQPVVIVADTNVWQVAVLGAGSNCGAASLVSNLLDALQAMRRASVPASQCLSFIEGKLREFCVLSKTLADMLMSTDFCDITTLTKSLNIDINDVPLLLAIATTHTPQVATRYGISYR